MLYAFNRMLRKILNIGFVLLIVSAVTLGIFSFSHPIILKWVVGSARNIGKPVNAMVYTNGNINNEIKVFLIDKYWNGKKTNNYILSLSEFDSIGKLKFISIDIQDKWVGRPSGTSKDDYDFVSGTLFQSEVGAHFTDFKNDTKGYSFDPLLTFTDKQIKFNVPPGKLKFDSVRIELGK